MSDTPSLPNVPGPNVPGSNTVPTPTTTIPPAITYSKRKIDEVVATFEESKKSKTGKCPKRSVNAIKTTPKLLDSVARYFPRSVHPYMDIGSALHNGADRHWGTPVDDVPSNETQMPASEKARQDLAVAAFEKPFKPGPPRYCQSGRIDASLSSSGRVADTGGLKNCVEYVLPNPTKHLLLPAIQKSDSKSIRGLAHLILRYYILPWSLRLQLLPLVIPTVNHLTPQMTGNDAQGADQAQGPPTTNAYVPFNSHILVLGSYDGTYDPEQYDKGLLCSELLLRVFRHIWTAPSSAFNGLDKGIPAICHARLHNKYKMELEMIGCAAVQFDGTFNYEKFFDTIVQLFSRLLNDTWAVDTLAWYDRMVFRDSAPARRELDAAPVPNAVDLILVQHAAHAASAASTSG
ncbi:hypothetical protein MVEN_00932600 [Mycena venus]|uniref:Uncharacterized protein n=1 Tax=Mycena venus TaxID=2733690 RepID=A0A8H6YCW6_9AGAR|nr:hypothetical protein MVEN_00932600 [Mycena venus]